MEEYIQQFSPLMKIKTSYDKTFYYSYENVTHNI